MTQASNSASHLFLGFEDWDFVPLTPRGPCELTNQQARELLWETTQPRIQSLPKTLSSLRRN